MTLQDKSIAFWLGGAAAGAIVANAKDKSPVIGGLFGGMLIGSLGDLFIEHRYRLSLARGGK